MVRCGHLWGLPCPLCNDIALDPLGHHTATCRRGGDVVLRHNHLRDVFVGFCHQAHLSVKVEDGSGLTPECHTPGQLISEGLGTRQAGCV